MLGVLVLLYVHERPKPSISAVAPAVVQPTWTSMLPAVTPVLTGAFPDSSVGQRAAVSVEEEKDITGDGNPEAMIDLGTGGASTEQYALVQYDNGMPVAASFQDADGTVGPITFLRGGSADHSDDFAMDSEDRMVYSISTESDPDTGLSCMASAYVWNQSTAMFMYSADRSSDIEARSCPAGSKPETN